LNKNYYPNPKPQTPNPKPQTPNPNFIFIKIKIKNLMEKFDHLYISITQEVGGLEGLFTSLFSFLLRRTDFFYESDPGDKMGFPPGVNEKMLLNIFNQFRNMHYKNSPKKSVEDYAQKYVKYAKENNLPLPKGMKPAQKIEKNPPKVTSTPAKSTPKMKSKVKDKTEGELMTNEKTTPKKPEQKPKVEVKKEVVTKPKNDMFSDIRY
jgi:hypothetical protein